MKSNTSDAVKSPTTPSVIQTLQSAADGLLFLSETDAPLTPFIWPADKDEKLTPELVGKLAGAPANTPIKSVKLETFFRPATQEEEWHNDEEKAQAQRFQTLVTVIKDTLEGIKVFRVGETNIDVYIVGTVEGGYAGLKTNIVET